jgi:UDP-glucose 4-epimerase
LEALEQNDASDAFNLGTGHGHSVREVIAGVERVTGLQVPHRIAPRRPGDPARLVAESSRSASELGWTPRISDLDTILATAWAWHQKAQG